MEGRRAYVHWNPTGCCSNTAPVRIGANSPSLPLRHFSRYPAYVMRTLFEMDPLPRTSGLNMNPAQKIGRAHV